MNASLEYIAVASGVVYVLLATKGNKWCWSFGIVSAVLYIIINIEHRLFQDAILQTYYVFAGFYGWWKWSRKDRKEEANIVHYSLRQNLGLLFCGALLVPLFGYAFAHLGNALSYFDSTVMIFSFIATWMTAKKILENWLFWVVIDLVASAMYGIKGLYPTSGLYLLFSAIAAYGYVAWKKEWETVQKTNTHA